MYQTCRISWQEVTRSDKYSVLSYVVFSFSSALIARSLRAQHHISGKTTFRTGLPPWVINGEAHKQLFVYDQASGTRFPVSVSGTCVALPCSPWSSSLAPPAPPPVAQVCSPASTLL